MTVEVDFFELIIGLSILFVAAFLVPLLIQLRSTVKNAHLFLDDARQELMPMLKELRETSERINRTSGHADELVESLSEMGESLKKVNSFLVHDVGKYAGNAIGLWLGMKAASKVFLKQMREERKETSDHGR